MCFTEYYAIFHRKLCLFVFVYWGNSKADRFKHLVRLEAKLFWYTCPFSYDSIKYRC